MDTQQPINELFQCYLDNLCTGEDLDRLIEFFGTADESVLRKLISSALLDEKVTPGSQPNYDQKLSLIFNRIKDEIQTHEATVIKYLPQRSRYLWLRIAAAILIFISVGGYFLLSRKKVTQQVAQNQANDVSPARDQATLTLANGKKIKLIRGLSGKLAQEGTATVRINSGNAIAYTASDANANAPIEYNTLSTARGEESPYPLVLADGTKVWLNAMSSITFPTAFNGTERLVKITGEAYFEVVHNRSKPFRVTVKGQTIEDLGTHFNVNAYDDELSIKTTLTEGSVWVSVPNSSSITAKNGVRLKPGQQSVVQSGNSTINIREADLDAEMAWKNGMFAFNNADIKTIMRQLARWYNVEVVFSGNVDGRLFTGEIPRDSRLSEVLKALQISKINFKIEGEKVIVYP